MGEQGVHGSKVEQDAACVVDLALVVLSKSKLQYIQIGGWIVRRNADIRTTWSSMCGYLRSFAHIFAREMWYCRPILRMFETDS